MQLKIDLDFDVKDQIDWAVSEEISEMHSAPSHEAKETISRLKNFVLEYQDLYLSQGGMVKINAIRDDLFKSIPMHLWKESFFVMEAFKLLAPTDSMYLFPMHAWGNPVFIQQIEHNENFFKLVWYGGLELLMEERNFVKYIVEPQQFLYGETFDEKEFSFVKLELKNKLDYLFNDLDWVIPQIKDNPYLYPYLSKTLKVNDNVLALTFSSINGDEKSKPLFVDLIPYQEIAKDSYVFAAFLTFFYYKVKKYEAYFSYALKMLKSETQVQALIEHLDDDVVFKQVFNHKDFPQIFRENTSVLLQSLRKCKEIYHVLPEYMQASKAVVEIMIYEHNADFLDAKSLDYWRNDIIEPKLNGPVYEYLKNRVEDLRVLKFVHWRRNFDFIFSLEKNPFEYNVSFSEDDFEVLTAGRKDLAIELIRKFPNFYEVSGPEIKCNLECIVEYIKNGLGLFEDRFNYIHPKLFYNDELIFEFINNDWGDVLMKIPDEKWNSKKFLLEYLALMDNLKDTGEENAFECLYSFLPQRVQNFFELNGVHSNFARFLKIDQLNKYQYLN